ncbi:MAG: nicotinate-nucleotide adenylyltransferase [Anaerolineaceae bacterium]|nr:nicotinate-nucleotide adenylyltransferase [Anaerolineaceae bacterium]
MAKQQTRHTRIGVFGGTFDPPHIGHMILAAEARSQLKLDRILWVLTSVPPHKRNKTVSATAQRLALVQAAIRDEPAFTLSTVDIEREGPYYAVDTMRLLRAQYPQVDLIYLIGEDSLHDLPTWYQPQALVDEVAGIGVMRRPGKAVDMQALEAALPGIRAKVTFVEAPLLEISSSQVRQRISKEETYQYYLLPAVYELIQSREYYRQRT